MTKEKKPAINAKMVMAYLTKHQSFFAQDTKSMRELIRKLRLIHPASKREVSLMMYQNHLLRKEAEETKEHYAAIREIILYERDLQKLVFTAYQEIEKAQNLPQFCQIVDTLLSQEFGVEAKRLVFFTKVPLLPYYQIKSYTKMPAKLQKLMAAGEPTASTAKEVGSYFFDEQPFGSYLILPLRTKKKPFAVLCLADKSKQRFKPDTPNLLMHFFATILARELDLQLKNHTQNKRKKNTQAAKSE